MIARAIPFGGLEAISLRVLVHLLFLAQEWSRNIASLPMRGRGDRLRHSGIWGREGRLGYSMTLDAREPERVIVSRDE